MSVPVAVVDPLPAYRRGLAAVLCKGGFEPVEPDDWPAWAAQEGPRGLVVTLTAADDRATVARLTQARADLVVVALLPEATTGAYRQAVLTGCAAAVARDAAPEQILGVVQAGVEGDCRLPRPVAEPSPPRGPAPTTSRR